MVNTSMTHVFKHPKFYRIPRDKSDQAISLRAHDGERERAPDPGLNLLADSSDPVHGQQPSLESGATSYRRQASSVKPQAPEASSDKRQAPSSKRQA